jgi:hypothetical protein
MFFIREGESIAEGLWRRNRIAIQPLRPALKVRKVNNFSPPFISGPNCIFSHTVSAAHSKKKSVSFEKTVKRKIPAEGVILANGQLRELARNVMDATTMRRIVAAMGQGKENARGMKRLKLVLCATFGDFPEISLVMLDGAVAWPLEWSSPLAMLAGGC